MTDFSLRLIRYTSMGLLLLPVIFLGACAVEHGLLGKTNGAQGIVGGQVVPLGSFQAEVTVAIRKKSDSKVFCTASLISESVLLTAAHCLVENGIAQPADNLEAVFEIDAEAFDLPDHRIRQVVKYVVHEGFTETNLDRICPQEPCRVPEKEFLKLSGQNDLALILLSAPAPSDYQAVSIEPVSDLRDGEEVLSIGYGYNRGLYEVWAARLGAVSLSYSGVLHMRASPLRLELRAGHAVTKVRESFGKILVPSTEKAGTCSGDSGGPLLVRRKDSWHQIGVASHLVSKNGAMACLALSTAYVDLARYQDWVASAAKELRPPRQEKLELTEEFTEVPPEIPSETSSENL